jgi:hypothetical protein
MNVRKTLLAVALAGSLAAPLAVHSASVNFNVEIAPPAPVYEHMPARKGYIVTPGYYRYDQERHAHTWVKGEYQRARRGEHYVASEWRQQEGRYGFDAGRWEKDNKGG